MIESLKNYNFKFNKNYGQNFIFDTNLLKAIVSDAEISCSDDVLEIGTGAGTLTKIISSYCKNLVSYEIDKNLEPIIKEHLSDVKNVQVKFVDIMKEKIEDIEANFSGNYKMVANLPYYITTPIIFKFVDYAKNLSSMAIMVQKEVADRLVAKHNSANYGAITAVLNVKADISIARIVKRNMFTPAPNVDSAIVLLKFRNKYNIINNDLLNKVIKSAFNMRRKTLINNLKNSFNISTENLTSALQALNLQVNIRGEALSPEQFVSLANELNQYIKE